MRMRIVVVVALVVALAGAAVGALGLSKANSTDTQLHKTRAELSTLQDRVTDLVGATAARQDTTAPSLASIESSITTLQSDVAAIVRACPDKQVNSYYQRLLGATQTGTDETAEINLLVEICPNVQQ